MNSDTIMSTKGHPFTYTEKDDDYELHFSFDNTERTVSYTKYFPEKIQFLSEKDKMIETIRMGFLIDNCIKKLSFENEVNQYYANK